MTGIIHAVVIDAADIAATANFYGAFAGFKEDHVDDDWITLRTPANGRVSFQLAPDHVPAQWPGQEFPQQFHLDFVTPDMAGEVERAVSLGAVKLPGGGESWTVLADPAGHPFCVCAKPEAAGLTLLEVAIDCPDGKALGEFYAAILGYEMTYSGDEGAFITGGEGTLPIMFQNVAGYHAPQWPDPAHPQQAHLDIDVADIAESEKLVLSLGATRLKDSGGTTTGYRVYADPAGHPFCLVWGQ
jgi:catechol 2,3-dioxygenase-like lactoylglutathione lyase family enzyme